MDFFQDFGNSDEVAVPIGERPKRTVCLLAKNPIDDLTDDLVAEYAAVYRRLQAFEKPNPEICLPS